MKYDGIIFDLDGTLWDATAPIRDSWNEVLATKKNISKTYISEKELDSCMGLVMYDIAAKLFNKEEKELQRSLMDELCSYENEYLAKVGGTLYEGLEETLEALSKEFLLYIVSNCQSGYIEAFLKAHGLEKYFKDIECWGNTRLPKNESIRILVERNNLSNPVYVGDTKGDMESAHKAGVPFIYAAYGFGQVEEKDCQGIINKFSQLKEIL